MADADVAIQFTSDHEKLIQDLHKQNAKLERMIANLRKVNRTGKDASKSMGSLVSHQTAMRGLAVAVGAVATGLRKLDQDAKKAASSFLTEEVADQRLAQIAKPQKELRRLHELANTIGVSAGMTRTEAKDYVFAGKSAGFTDAELQRISALRDIQPNLTEMLRLVLQMRTQGGAAAGTPMQALNMVLAAAQKSPLGLGEMGAPTTKAMAAFKLLGATQEEMLSTVAFAAQAANPDVASTWAAAFASWLGKQKEYAGLGFEGAVTKFAGKYTRPDGTLDQIRLGQAINTEEARRGASFIVQNIAEIMANAAIIKAGGAAAGTSRSPIQRSLLTAHTDPNLIIQRESRVAAAIEGRSMWLEEKREATEQAMLARTRGLLQRKFQRGEITKPDYLARLAALGGLDVMNLDPFANAGRFARIGVGIAPGVNPRWLDDASQQKLDAFLAGFEGILDGWRRTQEDFRRVMGSLERAISGNAAGTITLNPEPVE